MFDFIVNKNQGHAEHSPRGRQDGRWQHMPHPGSLPDPLNTAALPVAGYHLAQSAQ